MPRRWRRNSSRSIPISSTSACSRAAPISTKSAASTRCDGNRSPVRTSTTSSKCRLITIRRRSGSCACSCTVVSAVPRRTRKRRAGKPTPAGRTPNRIEGEKQIYLHPSGWIAAQWWDEEQVDNILRAVDALKRKYNIDESKIYITGISDGGTGVYYMALKEPNPWSAYLPLNGSLAVLRNPDNGADGEMHGNNFINSALYVVNGENDPLYPVAQVEPHIAWLKKMGVNVTFRPQAGAVHNTAWWPTERAPFEQFVHDHPRAAHPAGAVLGDRARRSLQSQPLADHQRAASGCVEGDRAHRPGFLPAHQAIGTCRHPPQGEHVRCDRPRRGSVHAAAVPGRDRFHQAGRRDRERQAGVQRNREEGSGHVDALGRARQRSHRALRRRTEDRRSP